MRRLRIVLASTSALVALSSPSIAADLATKAPAKAVAPPVAAAYSWTGWYAGGNIGGSWGRAKGDFDIPGFSFDTGGLAGVVDVPGVSGSQSMDLNGVIGGVQLGYNWQASPNWLFGLEADFQGSGQKGDRTFADSAAFTVNGEGVTVDSLTHLTAKVDWFGTLRARIGFVQDRWLFYVTGGAAYGHVKLSGFNTTTVVANGVATDFDTDFSRSKTRWGGTIGGGIEGVSWWDQRWTWRVEYLYINLGKHHINGDTPDGDTFTVSTKFTDNIARFALNYRF